MWSGPSGRMAVRVRKYREQRGPVEVRVIVDPALDAGIRPRRQLLQGFASPAAQPPRPHLASNALGFVRTDGGCESVEESAVFALDSARPKLVPQVREPRVLM